ncbi:radical SAM protein [Tissierella praeacuta]|uniref:radical SAM protein n=1 Tax=Tissierella praeacuta TaxID=43131 RepID=UPI00333FE765
MELLNMEIYEIVEKALAGNKLTREEIIKLYSVDCFSKESYYIQWAGRKMSMEASGGIAEIHSQIGLDANPCPMNCQFCSFAVCNKLRTQKMETPLEDIIEYAKIYEYDGANLILLLTTANYEFEKLLEVVSEVRNVISKDLPLLANTADMTLKQAEQLKKEGVNGVYHAIRLREGIVTNISVEERLKTIDNIKKSGLELCTCVEPIGPEHTPEELADSTLLSIDIDPVFSGAGKRIAVPGTMLAQEGMISEVKGALYVAIYRLAAGRKNRLNCSGHSMLTANAGANIAWSEVGTNPRDLKDKTEYGGRGQSIESAKKVFSNTEWKVLEGPSPDWK